MSGFDVFYDIVRKIPYGRIATYGQIAAMAGAPRSARVVGWALHVNPDPAGIPCHRVLNRNGEVSSGFAFGGPGVQRSMLEGEGVVFDEAGRVDLEIFLWRDDNARDNGIGV